MKENKRKPITRPISAIGKKVPRNLRFGIIVAVAIFWAEVLKTFFNIYIAQQYFKGDPLIADIFIAISITIIAYLVFAAWHRIDKFLERTRVPNKLQKI